MAPLLVLSSTLACGSDPEPPPPPTELAFRVIDGTTGAAIPAAWVVVEGLPAAETDASGAWTVEVAAGAHRVWVQAAGFATVPGRGEPALIAEAVSQVTTPVEVTLRPLPGAAAGGHISGRVTDGGSPVMGALVIARSTVSQAAVTDADGRYRLLGLPPNSYRLRAVAPGRSFGEQTGVSVTVGETTEAPDLSDDGGALATLSGSLTVSSTGAEGQTQVQLLDADTGARVPDLSAAADLAGSYTLAGVAKGRYRVQVAYEDDGWVLDPDLIRREEEPIIDVDGADLTLDLPLVRALGGVSVDAGGGAPVISWTAHPDADFYVPEVINALGQQVWGGLDSRQAARIRVLAPETSVTFGDQVDPFEALVSGGRYRVRVYAAIEVTTGNLFELIAANEEASGELIAP